MGAQACRPAVGFVGHLDRPRWCRPRRGRLVMTSLGDDAARRKIRTDTASTIFVEAGAGSGKTKSLVDRVVTLVLCDGIPLERIAAVTFTEKAGSELRDRLRVAFDPSTLPADALTNEDGRLDRAERTVRAERALEAIDGAAIGTLHSFAHRILTLHPVEANLPPLIEVLDEVASSVAFDERWSVLQRELLDEPALKMGGAKFYGRGFAPKLIVYSEIWVIQTR